MSESMGGNKKRPRNSPSSKRYKAEGRSVKNKARRIAKEIKKMERARKKSKERGEK